MVSKASDDLPDPLTPVKTISCPAGSVRSTFFRLCVRAPRMTSADELTSGGMMKMKVYRRDLVRASNLQYYSNGSTGSNAATGATGGVRNQNPTRPCGPVEPLEPLGLSFDKFICLM